MSILSLLKINHIVLFLLILSILTIIDFFAFQISIKVLYKNNNKYLKILFTSLFCIISIVVYFFLAWTFFIHKWNRNVDDFIHIYYFSGCLVIIYISKFIFLLSNYAGLLLKFIGIKLLNKFSHGKNDYNFINTKNISLIGLFVAILTCLTLIYGVFFGRFQYQIKYCNLEFENLPVSFDKLKIVQISDLHISTYHSHEKQFERIIELVNSQNPDIIFFTGDLINNFAEEVIPYVPKLRNLKAKYGKYAILGNHDYGDYYIWHNEKEKQENHQLLIAYIKSADFKLLINENIALVKYKDTIIIAGTENYGPKPYRQAGDLEKTLKGTTRNNFIMLLSHDPFIWDHFVRSHPNIKVTFSGHTHGMQIGINCGTFNWTPFHYGYKRWNGLYKENNQFLYVNKGLGAGLYTGRIGMWPEITVFELRREK